MIISNILNTNWEILYKIILYLKDKNVEKFGKFVQACAFNSDTPFGSFLDLIVSTKRINYYRIIIYNISVSFHFNVKILSEIVKEVSVI